MGLFRRKKEDELDQGGAGEKLSRPRRKKKPEPPKPWGKKERLLVLFVLAFTVGTSGVLALSARSWKLPGLPRIRIPSFSLFKEGTVVINKRSNSADLGELVAKSEEVKKQFEEKTKDLSGVYGLYVVDLHSGFSYGLNESEVFQAASLVKLPVMIGMYLSDRGGDLELDDIYSLRDEDKVSGSGSLSSQDTGSEFTYRELVKLMGKKSDNTAYRVCLNILGEDKVNEVIEYIGMNSTSLEKNETTPQDMGNLLVGLWAKELLGTTDTDELLSFLTDTIYEEWLSAGVGSERVAHKYGRETNVVNDAGVVYTDSPYVVVIMSKGVVGREADEVFPELSRIVYEAHKR